MEYTRNSDPDYYNNNRARANCGSYALRLREWYDPEIYLEEQVGSIYDWVEELTLDGYNDYEITEFYINTLADGMLMEFEGELTICDGQPPHTSDEELIALNGFCHYDEDEGLDMDFHFKVFRDNKWMEKRGIWPVNFCEEDEWGRYIGEPIYMYHKIDIKGANDETAMS